MSDAGTTPPPAPGETPPFRRPPSAVGLLGLGALLVVLGIAVPRLAAFSAAGATLALVGLVTVPVGAVLLLLAVRRMALGLEAVYDHLEARSAVGRDGRDGRDAGA